MNIKYFTCFFVVAASLLGEITTYSPKEKRGLNRYSHIWKEPNFRIDQHNGLVHKTIDRVILSVNENSKYLGYWEPIARAWSRFIGVKPTLIYIGEGEVPLSTEVGEIIHIPPVEKAPTAFQAQCVRLLAPALFPDEICVIADIDQFPLNAEFFHRPLDILGKDSFIMYELLPRVHKRIARIEFRMSYNAAKGSTFSEIFGVSNIEEIREKLALWYHQDYKKYGFHTDQRLLFRYVSNWPKFNSHCYHLGRDYLTRAIAKALLVQKKQLINISTDDTSVEYALDPDLIEEYWKGRYTEVYLQKGETPFNHFMYKTFGLDS